jgi:hypothetical protein
MLNDDVFAVSGNFAVGFCEDASIVPRPEEVEEEQMILYTDDGAKIYKNL